MKFIKYRENKLTVTKYVQNVHHWHEHKHASVLAIECDSDVIFTSHVK